MSRATERAGRLLPGGVPRWVRCYDNEGESADRYTVVFTGRYTHKTGGVHWYLGASAHPSSAQGAGITGEDRRCIDTYGPERGYRWPPALGRKCHLGRRVRFVDLPPGVQRFVLDVYTDLWDL